MIPASASAPAITRNSICSDAVCLAIDESAAASATVASAGGACLISAGAAGGSAAAERKLFDELMLVESSQRVATVEDGVGASG